MILEKIYWRKRFTKKKKIRKLSKGIEDTHIECLSEELDFILDNPNVVLNQES